MHIYVLEMNGDIISINIKPFLWQREWKCKNGILMDLLSPTKRQLWRPLTIPNSSLTLSLFPPISVPFSLLLSLSLSAITRWGSPRTQCCVLVQYYLMFYCLVASTPPPSPPAVFICPFVCPSVCSARSWLT